MDMRDALIEVKEFSNDNNELDESLIGLLRTTSITVNVAKSIQSGKKVQLQSRELKQISDRLKVNKTKDDVQKTIAEGFIVLSLLFINIEDNGPGIPSKEFENVFKPFYKIDRGRADSKSSVGLGLSISSDIIKSHGGDIKFDISKMGGLKVIISLPY